uniref:Piezo type mechanosensitive ion channel component 2 n=1 Tax=Scleropages formosus TaxID=113540 RepID=A0A8C9TX84_SCLFO
MDFEAEEQEELEDEEEQEERAEEDENILLDEDFEAGNEFDVYEEELAEDAEEQEESTKMRILRRIAGVASKVKEIIGNLITTAGQVVVTILLGLTGIMLPSLTSAVYFFVFLGLCTWWSLCRTFEPLVFSCLCVLMAIYSAGHLIVLYMYQLQFFQEAVPAGDIITPIFVSQLFMTAEEKKDGSVCEVSDAQEVASVVTEVDENTKSSTLATIFKFIMKQSYICALIAMMAWSITYVSWLTFVFLIWSCTLWMMRDRRKYAMLTSPFMVMYGNLMIILQYIWSFEQIKGIAGLFLKQDILFLLTFWLLLRQFLTERQERLKQDTELLDVKVDDLKKGERDKEIMQVLGNMVMAMFVKYWIYICGGMFFFVSFEGRTVLYKIIYMMMLLFCVALYQVHYEWWRRILKYFWMSVVVYTMLVLTLVYTFQFETSPHVWSNMTGLTINELKDLGLERFSVRELFIRIFIPTSFLLVCILHLHYFHDRFLQLTDLKAVQANLADIAMISSPAGIDMKEQEEKALLDEGMEKSKQKEALETPGKNKWHLVVDRLTVLFLKFLEYFHKLQVFIWWLLEMHIIKIVSSYIILVCINEVSVTLFNYVFLASWAFALPFSQFRPLASSVCTVWTCVIIACKMLYQLDVIEPKVYSSNCSMPDYTIDQKNKMQKSLLYSDLIDPSNWVGLQKYGKLLGSLRNNFLMLAILAFEVTIYRHQEYYRLRNNLIPPVARIIFHDITRQHLDDGIISCAKYFINYFFYKFGVETCFLLAVNVIGQRMDFYAMLHAFSLIAVMYRRRRKAIAEVWPKYCCFLACMLTFQYFVCIGIPPAACKDYPWRFPNSTMNSDVVKWLYFPDFLTKPNPMFLAYDFMLLLCASLQRQVFEDENKAAMRIMAGDNVEICRDLDAASFSLHNPVPDFIYCRSYLDMLKVIVFSYLFWFVLTIIFITGTTRISIFCMGYLVACFYFLLFGGNLLLKPIKKILHFWDFLIAYNVFVITMKNVLSIAACGFIIPLVKNNCWVVQLFSLACTIKGYSEPPKDRCELPKGEAGIIWDSICFAFLLLQRRVFMSYYFLHVVADIRSSQILASRTGLGILGRRRVFCALGCLTPPCGEAVVTICVTLCPSVVRSGDYYLFETDSEDEEEEEDEKKQEAPPKKSAFQVRWTDKNGTEEDSKKSDGPGWCRDIIPKSCWFCSGSQQCSCEMIPLRCVPTDNIIKRIFNIIKFTWILFLTTLESFTAWLNSMCREHIDISTVLRMERCMLTREVKKVDECMAQSYTPDTDAPATCTDATYPTDADVPPSYSKAVSFDHISVSSDEDGDRRLMVMTPDESRSDYMDDIPLPSLTHELTASELMFHDEELEASERFYQGQPQLLQLCYALYNMLVARSEMVCYLVIILNHMISASMATLVLPILIFLWAMLSVPRPSKRFWMTAIVYTEVVHYFFQFGFFPFNQNISVDKSKPYHPPNIIGIEKKDGYVHYDLVQLLALFFHRSILKCHGLWDDDDPNKPQKGHLHREDSEDEAQMASEIQERKGSDHSLKSVNLAASLESVHVRFPESQAHQRRKSSTASSHISRRSSYSTRSKRALEIYLPIRQFFYNLIHPEYSAVTDVYVLMFLADTVDFIIIVFGFWAFGKHSAAADITSSLSEDQVPEAFLVMVLIQFSTMVVDRALYLRKTVLGKVIFQVILVFGIHTWMFFILPGVTQRRFNQNTVAQLWYFVKCIYFGLSAYQIRCGYPTRVLGNFLTKSYNYLNLFFFQGFRLVPFLTELRAVMDWVWTDTTLSLSSWICVEDIYAHIFVLKCWRESEKRYPQPRGQKKKKVVKYGMGGMIVVLLICIVWFPLLFMSLVKSVAGVVNKPLDVSVTITLGGFQPIFTMSAQQNQLKDTSSQHFRNFKDEYQNNDSAQQFLDAYTYEDLTIAELEGNSNSMWTISPPSRENLIELLANIKRFVSFSRNLTLGAKAEVASYKHIAYLGNNTKKELLHLLNGTRNEPVSIPHIFPCYIRAPSTSEAKPVSQLYTGKEYEIQGWWIVNQTDSCHSKPKNRTGLELCVFSDQVSPPSLGFLAGYGIMGLYASVVLVIGKFVREFFSGISHTIMFEELPNVDRILKLCTDIFLVRETGELDLEEDLYAKLIFLYRSPETMIKWTREKSQ